MIDRTNPLPYCAPYFGYKAHLDQSERKAQQFGLTRVTYIDGCSRLVASFVSISIKNPILIYEYVYVPAVSKYGFWDQIRMIIMVKNLYCLIFVKCFYHFTAMIHDENHSDKLPPHLNTWPNVCGQKSTTY